MAGDFVSTTGEDFSEVCTLQYSLSMQSDADDMVPKVGYVTINNASKSTNLK